MARIEQTETPEMMEKRCKNSKCRAFSSNFGKRPFAEIGKKKIDLTSKLGENNEIEHYEGSKIYLLFVLLLYVPSQQLWSLRDGQFT